LGLVVVLLLLLLLLLLLHVLLLLMVLSMLPLLLSMPTLADVLPMLLLSAFANWGQLLPAWVLGLAVALELTYPPARRHPVGAAAYHRIPQIVWRV